MANSPRELVYVSQRNFFSLALRICSRAPGKAIAFSVKIVPVSRYPGLAMAGLALEEESFFGGAGAGALCDGDGFGEGSCADVRLATDNHPESSSEKKSRIGIT